MLRRLADCRTPLPPPVVNILRSTRPPARTRVCPSLRLPHTPHHALPFSLSSVPPVSLGRRSPQCARVSRCPSVRLAAAVTSTPFDERSPGAAGRVLGRRGTLSRGRAGRRAGRGARYEAPSCKTDQHADETTVGRLGRGRSVRERAVAVAVSDAWTSTSCNDRVCRRFCSGYNYYPTSIPFHSLSLR